VEGRRREASPLSRSTSCLMRKILEISVFMLARGRRRNEIDPEA
jgi:hypothetical protein